MKRLPTDDIMDLPMIRRASRAMAKLVVELDRKIRGPEIRQPDFLYNDEGSIILLLPLNRDAWDWVADNIDPQSYTLWCGRIPIERRHFPAILDGIEAANLTFSN